MENIQNWELQRLGKFTASAIFNLLNEGKNKNDYFGQTAKTYINDKVGEILTQQSNTDLTGVPAVEYGNSLEYDAMQLFETQTNIKCEYYGKANPKFIPAPKFEDWAGGSPDFETIDAIGEIKCPFKTSNHIANLLISSEDEFMKLHKDYYTQIQFNMYCTGKHKAYFVSFDGRMIEDDKKLCIININYNESFINNLLERLKTAIIELKVIINCIDSNIKTN